MCLCRVFIASLTACLLSLSARADDIPTCQAVAVEIHDRGALVDCTPEVFPNQKAFEVIEELEVATMPYGYVVTADSDSWAAIDSREIWNTLLAALSATNTLYRHGKDIFLVDSGIGGAARAESLLSGDYPDGAIVARAISRSMQRCDCLATGTGSIAPPLIYALVVYR